MSQWSMSTWKVRDEILIVIRYVYALQERISFLESHLNRKKSLGDVIEGGSSLNRGLPGHDLDRSVATALSALSKPPTSTTPCRDSATSHASNRPNDTEQLFLTTPKDGHANKFKTYEWDERGNEEELITDCMGSASKGDTHSGFFGIHL
jgi:hypothetical protein